MRENTECRTCDSDIDINVNDLNGDPLKRSCYEFWSNNRRNEIFIDINIPAIIDEYQQDDAYTHAGFDALIEAARHEHPEIVQWLEEKRLIKELSGRHM